MPLLTPENRGRYSAGFSLACCYAGRDKHHRNKLYHLTWRHLHAIPRVPNSLETDLDYRRFFEELVEIMEDLSTPSTPEVTAPSLRSSTSSKRNK
nr:hypothetical protein Iba_chr04aCG15960 [Ipomoea batatas]GMC82552.1 hypothetical protein Iba_chr04bCG14440 [Ipomoea batatas]